MEYYDTKGILLCFIIMISIGFILGWGVTQHFYKQEAIDHGFAEHDRITGKWQWIEKGEK